MDRPLVSVCVPVYNGAPYLERCLRSIAEQTYDAIEVLLVDDGSTDGSADQLDAFAAGRSNVSVHRNEANRGLTGNWNRCVELARGEWVKFVFQDDWITPRCVATMVEHAHAGTGLVVCGRTYEFADGVRDDLRTALEWLRVSSARSLGERARTLRPDDVAELLAVWGNWNFLGEPVAVLYRRDVMQHVGPFPRRFLLLSDYAYWLRIAMGAGLSWVPEQLAGFLVHGASVSGANWQTFEVQHLEAAAFFAMLMTEPSFAPFRDYLERTGQRGRYAAAVRWLVADSYHAARWMDRTPDGAGTLAAWRRYVAEPEHAALLDARRVERLAPLHRVRHAWRRRTGGTTAHLDTLRPIDRTRT